MALRLSATDYLLMEELRVLGGINKPHDEQPKMRLGLWMKEIKESGEKIGSFRHHCHVCGVLEAFMTKK